MPTAELDDCEIEYEEFGAHDGRPVLLIHGARATGSDDWGAVAPILALRRRLIVPDCRGHGRSSNPAGTYSFAQMAADMAGLIQQLGLGPAHVVGHSNGGNVALVMLLEHPGAVATCVLQAANAYVSQDLFELGQAFDPERVEREAPALRDRMIRLHGDTHGPDYWRRLLALTFEEITQAPNYTPDDLARVRAPTLVIEGEGDSTNAPAHHAEHIASSIPAAELWRPEHVGHSVHKEVPTAWIDRVESFWARRGSELADQAWRLAASVDRRTSVFEVTAVETNGQASVTGVVLDQGQKQDLDDLARRFGATSDVSALVLETRHVSVVAPVGDVHRFPDWASERVTQALLGEEATAFDSKGPWTRVRLTRDGYVGWMRAGLLVEPPISRIAEDAPKATVWADVSVALDDSLGAVIGRLPFGVTLSVAGRKGGYVALRTPAGASWWVARTDVREPADGTEFARLDAGACALRFVGLPYLWGGRSAFGFDCSGLTQTCLAAAGIIVPRDADQQWLAGAAVDGDATRGDLVFFAEAAPSEKRILHVGIALDPSTFVHAWGATETVTVSSLDQADDRYAPTLHELYVGARRFDQRAP